MNEDNKAEAWGSIKEIAKHLGITLETLRKWIKKGIIPCHRVGKLWKFKISKIDAWVMNSQAKNE